MSNDRRLMQFYFITQPEESAHYHQNPEMFYVLNGTLNVQIDDKEYEMHAGDIILINANKRHVMTGKEGVLAARFEIDFHLLAEAMESMQLLFWCNTIVDRNEAYKELRQILDRILSRFFEKEEKNVLHLNALYYEAAHILTSNFLVKTDDVRLESENSQDIQRIRQIQNYIQANYQSQISLSDLANRLYLSNAYLSKYIKRHLSLTFMEYLNNVRLFHAVDELLYSEKNITHIALDNGFPTSAAFTKAFKDVYGESPSEYRKQIDQQRKVPDEGRNVSEKELASIQQYLKLRAEEAEQDAGNVKECIVDAGSEGSKFAESFKSVCIGEAYNVLHSDVQRQLIELKKSADIKYARIWNFLSREDCVNEQEGCNFRKIDMVLDFLLENQIKPCLELGHKETVFMYTPDRYLKTSEKVAQYSAETADKIFCEFMMHIVNRYGVEEIEKWYFEFWCQDKTEMEHPDSPYYRKFNMIYRRLKEISPEIHFGGAGFILGYERIQCNRIFRVWKEQECQPDFISVYSYQYIGIEDEDRIYGRKSIDKDYMKNQIDSFKGILKETGMGVKNLVISEWNFTISNRNLLNDSCEQGAYILKTCIDMAGEVQAMSYWHALDSYSDYYDSEAILNGDSGLISRDGIYKPSFYAFAFMKRLLPNIIYKDEHVIVTTNHRGDYVIACHNFKKLSSQYAFKEEDQIQLDELDNYTVDNDSLKIKFRLDHVKNGNYIIKENYINRSAGSVQDIWKSFEYEKNLSKDEIEHLKKSAIPKMEMHHFSVKDGTFEFENILMEQEIRLLDIRYRYSTE